MPVVEPHSRCLLNIWFECIQIYTDIHGFFLVPWAHAIFHLEKPKSLSFTDARPRGFSSSCSAKKNCSCGFQECWCPWVIQNKWLLHNNVWSCRHDTCKYQKFIHKNNMIHDTSIYRKYLKNYQHRLLIWYLYIKKIWPSLISYLGPGSHKVSPLPLPRLVQPAADFFG